MIGFAICGSFCTHSDAAEALRRLLARGYEVQPIMSECAYRTDTRFHLAEDFRCEIEILTGRRVIHTVEDAEPLGPATPLDALVIAPCTGNTLAKLANGITDTAVTMAAKAHLRQDRPLLIALATNDALSANLNNIATMMSRKNIYFVPMSQDDPNKKPHSLVADFSYIPYTLNEAMKGKRVCKIIL